jgi:hypothetical protein
MEYAARTLQSRIQDVRLSDVTADIEYFDPRIAQRVSKILLCASDEIVIDDQFTDVIGQQSINCVGAYQAGPSDNDKFLPANFHKS